MTKRIQDWLTDSEFIRVLNKTYKPHHKAAFVLAYHCGLRISEVINLKPEHIDRGQGLIKVVQGKGGKDRFVPYPRQIVKHFSQIPIKVGTRTLQKALKSAVERAGIKKDIHYHSLRHSFATKLINKGMSMKSVQQLMGHASIKTTMDIYSHMTLEDIKKEIQDKGVWG